MFKIKELPDISKWNTNKVTDMSYMFSNCGSLKSIPKNFKYEHVPNKEYMFSDCFNLKKK